MRKTRTTFLMTLLTVATTAGGISLYSCNDNSDLPHDPSVVKSESKFALHDPNAILASFVTFEDNQAVLNLSLEEASLLEISAEEYKKAISILTSMNAHITGAIENGAIPVFPESQNRFVTRAIISGEPGLDPQINWRTVASGNIREGGHQYRAQWTSQGYDSYRAQVIVTSSQFVWEATVTNNSPGGKSWVVGGTFANPGVVDLRLDLSNPSNNWDVTVTLNGPNGYGANVVIRQP